MGSLLPVFENGDVTVNGCSLQTEQSKQSKQPWQPPDEMKNWIGFMEMLRVYLFFVQACQFINIYEVKISCWFLNTRFSLNQPERAAVSDWLELSHSS